MFFPGHESQKLAPAKIWKGKIAKINHSRKKPRLQYINYQE